MIMPQKNYDIDQYDPHRDEGILPVRVLTYTYVEWFLKIYPSFIHEFNGEVQLNGLKDYITYEIDEKRIESVAELTPNKNIKIFETYNQFLWSISYSLIVFCDEVFLKASTGGAFKGNLVSNELTKDAMDLFLYAMSLTAEYQKFPSYNLPNPEKYFYNTQEYVEKCNGSFVASMTFILLHEYAHQYLGHIDCSPQSKTESKKRELDADFFAFDGMSTQFDTAKCRTIKLGIIIGLASLILLDSSLRGGDEHPDPDLRLKTIIEKMGLGDTDNFWVIASLAFILWGTYYNKKISFPPVVNDAKTLFNRIIDEIGFLKFSN